MQPRTPRSYARAVPTGDYPRKTLMPRCMDIYIVHGGATVDGVAQADAADLQGQGAHDVRYLRYWPGEAEGKIFCRGSRTGCRRRFRSAGSVVIRRRLAANLIGPRLPLATTTRLPRCPARHRPSPRDTARRPDRELTRGGWRRARAPWAPRASALELVVIKSGWDATHPSPRRELKGSLPGLTTAAQSARCAHSI
jgi:hypothetical protein